MPMTLVVTRDVESRYRGFLSSIMLEVSAGVYVSEKVNAGVRKRIWLILDDWYTFLGNGSIVMVWQDKNSSSGLSLKSLGEPPKYIVDADGILLVKSLLSV